LVVLDQAAIAACLIFSSSALFVCAPGAREGGDVGREAGVEFGEAGAEDAGVGLREEDGDPAALLGQLVAV
jgi:hypothetical protein